MTEPDRVLLILKEVQTELRAHSAELRNLNARLSLEFREIHDRLRRLDERMGSFASPRETPDQRRQLS
jgi:hypothetical protein